MFIMFSTGTGEKRAKANKMIRMQMSEEPNCCIILTDFRRLT